MCLKPVNSKKPYPQSTEVAGSVELGQVQPYHNRAWFGSETLSFLFIYNAYVPVIVIVNATCPFSHVSGIFRIFGHLEV